METQQTESAQLVQRTSTDFQRYRYGQINWNARMIGCFVCLNMQEKDN